MTTQLQATQIQNGTSSDLFNVNNISGVGVYNSPLKYYEVIPLAPIANFVSTGVVTPGINSYLPLNPENTDINDQGQTVVVLDCLRSIQITSTTAQASNQTFLVSGYDEKGVSVQASVTVYAEGDSDYTLKGFQSILSVQILTEGAVGTFSVGTNALISLPSHLCLSTQQIIACNWNGSPVTPVQNANPANENEVGFYSTNWRTTIPSSTTNDARGLFFLYFIPNGSAVFSVLYYQYGSDSTLQNALAANNYTAYTLIGYPNPGPYPTPPAASPRPANTQPLLLVAGDETGIQYPGQMNEYNVYFNNPVTP